MPGEKRGSIGRVRTKKDIKEIDCFQELRYFKVDFDLEKTRVFSPGPSNVAQEKPEFKDHKGDQNTALRVLFTKTCQRFFTVLNGSPPFSIHVFS